LNNLTNRPTGQPVFAFQASPGKPFDALCLLRTGRQTGKRAHGQPAKLANRQKGLILNDRSLNYGTMYQFKAKMTGSVKVVV